VGSSFLLAEIRKVSDDDSALANPPPLPGSRPIPAGAFSRVNTQPLQNQPGFRQTKIQQRIALWFSLHEYPVCCLQERQQSGGGVTSSRAVVGVFGIAEMKKRRHAERHVQPTSQPQPARDGPGIGERSGVDEIVLSIPLAGSGPHAGSDGIARNGE